MKESKDFNLELSYKKLEAKYKLPDFEILTQDFDIEKIIDKEPIFLIREIRRVINDKITSYLQLFEVLINPTSPPMFIFKILKNTKREEKEKIQNFYDILSKTQIKVMQLDSVYIEDKEVEFINETFSTWQKMKHEIYSLFEHFETNFENNERVENSSYLN